MKPCKSFLNAHTTSSYCSLHCTFTLLFCVHCTVCFLFFFIRFLLLFLHVQFCHRVVVKEPTFSLFTLKFYVFVSSLGFFFLVFTAIFTFRFVFFLNIFIRHNFLGLLHIQQFFFTHVCVCINVCLRLTTN